MITTGKFHCTSDQSFEEEEERRNLLEFSFSLTKTQSELQYYHRDHCAIVSPNLAGSR